MDVALTPRQAKAQAKRLERERAAMLKKKDRAKLKTLRVELRGAKQRRRLAMRRARQLCKVGRKRVRERVKAFRALERERVNAAVAAMKGNERAACKMRKARVLNAGGSLEARRRALLLEEQRTQGIIERAQKRVHLNAARSSAKERRQESDDAVRSNLPAELRPVWEQVKGDYRAGNKRASRTELFLEWAEANPGEVLRLQSDRAELEVQRLVRQKQRLERKLRSPKLYGLCAHDLGVLTRMGIAPSQAVARQRAHSLNAAAVPF